MKFHLKFWIYALFVRLFDKIYMERKYLRIKSQHLAKQ